MRGTRAGGVYDWDLDYLSPLMSLVYVILGVRGGCVGAGCAVRGGRLPAVAYSRATKRGGAEWELLPSPFRRPSPPVYARYTLAR